MEIEPDQLTLGAQAAETRRLPSTVAQDLTLIAEYYVDGLVDAAAVDPDGAEARELKLLGARPAETATTDQVQATESSSRE